MFTDRYAQAPYLNSTPPHYPHNGSSKLGVPLASSKKCPDCAKLSVIQEALFNRIQILETQVAKVSAEKDAAQQSLFRLIDVQTVARFQGVETPPSSLRIDSSLGGSPMDSLASSSQRNLAQCLVQANCPTDDNALIDLLDPVEQQPVTNFKEIGDPCEAEKYLERGAQSDTDVDPTSASPNRSFIGDENNTLPYVHHFVRKTPEPHSNAIIGGHAKDVSPTARVTDCAVRAPLVASSGLVENTIPQNLASYSSSFEEDLENSMLRGGVTSMTASFSSSDSNTPELPSQKNHVDNRHTTKRRIPREQVSKPEPNLKLSRENEYSKWASAYQGSRSTPNILSPEERWERYCENLFIGGPRRSYNQLPEPASVDINDAVILDQEGQAAKLNRFRYRNICGLCFNPQDVKQGVYRTIVVSKLPKDATMTDLLYKIRGGAILDAKMLDTNSITGHKTALLTFKDESHAMEIEDYTLHHPLAIAGQVVETSLVEVPTRPISYQLALDISKNQCTRCLYVHRFPRHIPPRQLRLDLRPDPVCKLDFVEGMAMSADNVLELRFLSVVAAMKAFHVLKSIARYRQCDIEYGQDICAGPWETPKLVEVVEGEVPHHEIDKDLEVGSLDTDIKA